MKIAIGARFYYKGDRANQPTYGTIIKFRPATRYSPDSVDVEYDSERFEGDSRHQRAVPTICFRPQPGQRFRVSDSECIDMDLD